MLKGPRGRKDGSVGITTTPIHAFHGVPFITAISFLSANVWIQSLRLSCSQCQNRLTLCSLLCLSTLIDEHTGVELDWVPAIVRRRQAPTNPPLDKVYEV